MKRISYVLGALAAIAIAAPAVAQDKPMTKDGMGDKPMMKEGMGDKPMMHHRRRGHHRHHHHMMDKPMTDKKM